MGDSKLFKVWTGPREHETKEHREDRLWRAQRARVAEEMAKGAHGDLLYHDLGKHDPRIHLKNGPKDHAAWLEYGPTSGHAA